MSGTRRLSLRARMLVMLVGVTTVFLLIMGTVSTYLLAKRVDGQIAAVNRHLAAEAAQLAGSPLLGGTPSPIPNGYSVVEVQVRSRLVPVKLTNSAMAGQLLAAVTDWLHVTDVAQVRALAAQAMLGRGCLRFPYLDCQTFTLGSGIRVATRWMPATGASAAGNYGRAVLFVAGPVSSEADQVRGFIIAELITGAALVALLAIGGEWLIGRGLEPLDDMTRTADAITSRGDLNARMPQAHDQDEVGRLGTSINTMLDRIQQAFGSRLRSEQKVREFAADASHELRTPLTTIRGYAELYRQGALGPDQLPNAMRRIEQEAERMSTLVAELLELARLDRTSSLDLTETDLASVVRDAVADAVAVEPRRPVQAEAPPRLVAVVDEPRIRQVLANLLGNVRAHTPITTQVAVRLGGITGGVLIEVADAGPGMSAQDAARAFDRFHRAADRAAAAAYDAHWDEGTPQPRADETTAATPTRELNGAVRTRHGLHRLGSRPRVGGVSAANGAANSPADVSGGSGNHAVHGEDHASRAGNGAARVTGAPARADRTSGSGLGLSIVQAIANAHGGRATLESWPGQGTKVRVWLPVRIVP